MSLSLPFSFWSLARDIHLPSLEEAACPLSVQCILGRYDGRYGGLLGLDGSMAPSSYPMFWTFLFPNLFTASGRNPVTVHHISIHPRSPFLPVKPDPPAPSRPVSIPLTFFLLQPLNTNHNQHRDHHFSSPVLPPPPLTLTTSSILHFAMPGELLREILLLLTFL